MTSAALLVELSEPAAVRAAASLADYLSRCGIAIGTDLGADAVVVLSDRPPSDDLEDRLGRLPAVLLAGPTLDAWRHSGLAHDLAGLLPGRRTPVHEIRLRPGPAGAAVTARLGDLVVTDAFPLIDKVADDVEVLLTANVALVDHPVMTRRDRVGALTVGTSAPTLADPAYARLVHRWLLAAWGREEPPPIRAAMIGYGAVGVEHARAFSSVPGLSLVAVCDRNPARVDAARQVVPGVRGYEDTAAVLQADDVDLVVVSTPPDSHAQWAMLALEAGKSVVVEKPFCLTTDEADAMIGTAAERGLSLSVYQNRRWDADYLALRQAVRAGVIGKVFGYESFVGGYGHPCNYWHSDAAVSGGAIYDWGSHHLDWALDLLPQEVEWVGAHAHKRVWHDVTNADHTRVTLHFADGVEAEFVASDLAAALKPKWYVLGTAGALVGTYRTASVLGRDAVGNLREDRLAPAESPAALHLHAPDGSVTALALPPAPAMPFHRELADLLLRGEPMSVTPAGSRRTTAVMQAATESARASGRPVEL